MTFKYELTGYVLHTDGTWTKHTVKVTHPNAYSSLHAESLLRGTFIRKVRRHEAPYPEVEEYLISNATRI